MALVVVVGGSRDITSKRGDMDFLPGLEEYHFRLFYDYFWYERQARVGVFVIIHRP